jgi:hypothetical protein
MVRPERPGRVLALYGMVDALNVAADQAAPFFFPGIPTASPGTPCQRLHLVRLDGSDSPGFLGRFVLRVHPGTRKTFG